MLTPDSARHSGGRIDVEAEQLHRDVALVVVHRDHGVELPCAQLDEHRVARHRAADVQPVGTALLDHRRGDLDVLPPEQAALAGVRIERRHRDARRGDAQIAHRRMGQVDGAAQPLRRQQLRHVGQRDMGR